jgi:hypothetical protein
MGSSELGNPARFCYFSQWLELGVGRVFASGSRAASCALRLAFEVACFRPLRAADLVFAVGERAHWLG